MGGIALVKIKINELSVGMVVSESIVDPQTKKLLLKGDTKLTEDLIKLLKARNITEVAISERYTLAIDPTDTTRKELKQLLYSEIIKIVPEKAEANPSDKITEVSKKAQSIINRIIENEDMVSFCVQMKVNDNEYLFKHCVVSCALSLLIAGAMGLNDEDMKIIGQAALIHDLGMCEMPSIIREGKRNEQEEALWREHPRYGYYFAKEKDIDDRIIKIILHHHEKWNGDGFPDKLEGEKIPLGSRIVAVCENYDRLLRYEKYPHYQAIEYLYGVGGYLFDSNVVNTFTNNLAVYPLGSLVRLSTGEVGVVVNVRKNLGPRPIVKVFFNRVNRPVISPREIDLGQERTVFIQEVL